MTRRKTIAVSEAGLESVRVGLAAQRWRLDAATLGRNGWLLTCSRVGEGQDSGDGARRVVGSFPAPLPDDLREPSIGAGRELGPQSCRNSL